MISKKKMIIIGLGRMGIRAANLFNEGFEVEIISNRDIQSDIKGIQAQQSKDIIQSISCADYIFLAVPVWVVKEWVSRINQYTRKDCMIIDCCTARLAAEKELSLIDRKRFSFPELGGEKIPVIGEVDTVISEYLRKRGIQLYPITSEEYDTNILAGIAHFIGMALDLHFNQDILSHQKESGAISCIAGLIQHLKSNSPSTYKETQLLNPFMSPARKNVIKALQHFDKELDAGEFKFEAFSRDKWRK